MADFSRHSGSARPASHQGHIARKRFGQNFLTDQGVISSIVRCINPQRDDVMVEIGPGLGALTEGILEYLNHLHAVELDRDLVSRLEKRYAGRVTIHPADALEFDFSTLAPAQGKLRIVGNLPYNISTPLLFHLAQWSSSVLDQHFMLQKEVVDRMTAEPGNKAYGRLSVMLQVRYWMESVLDVPPTAFHPAPKVDSAIVRMIPWNEAQRQRQHLDVDLSALEELVTAAFSQRRKVLRNTLADLSPRLDFAALNFDLTRRAEEVSVAEYVALAKTLRAV
jgi:16S rRNA (adenine1518-N6/adenine1519-N6)-dimethyltransferase